MIKSIQLNKFVRVGKGEEKTELYSLALGDEGVGEYITVYDGIVSFSFEGIRYGIPLGNVSIMEYAPREGITI